MVFCFAAIVLAAQAPKVTLTYFQEHFIVRDGVYSESAPLKLAPVAPRLSTLYRRNSTFAVWDERGLTIRVGPRIKSTKLPDIATSPKAFSREEIRETLREILDDKRSKSVSALSGSVRVGNFVYFLGRWEDKSGKPWAEALIRVDLTERFPEPKFVARPPLMSTADKAIDDELFILEGKVSYIARRSDRWGIEQVDPRSDRLSFEELGDKLESYLHAVGPSARDPKSEIRSPRSQSILFVEQTSYGTAVAGRLDLDTRVRKTLVETRAKLRFLDASSPECVIASFGDKATLINTSTGAQLDLQDPCSMRRTSRGIVIWTPVSAPKRAWLYDPVRWKGRAWWNASLSSNEG